MQTKMKVVFLLAILVSVLAFASGCEKKLGPGGALVNSFMKNWEFKRFAQMHEQTVHSRERRIFIDQMEKTPINWRNFAILSEKQVGEDWEVGVSLEVTDVQSAFAACVLNLQYAPEEVFRKRNFTATPALLGIERFTPIKQTWRVVNLDGKYFIDVCAAGSKRQRYENIMNYILGAGSIGFFGSNRENKFLSAAAWLSLAMIDLNLPADQAKEIMEESRRLNKKAEQNMLKMLERIDSLLKS